MAVYRIPEKHLKGFTDFISQSPDIREKIISIILNSKLGQSPSEISYIIYSELKLPEAVSQVIVIALAGLLAARDTTYDKVDEFIDGVLNAYYLQSKEEKGDIDSVKSQLKKVVEQPSNLKLTLKARSLVYEREKIIESFRIITDVRPVFDDSDGNEIKGTAIIHSIKISYSKDGTFHKAIFALDEKDLKDLGKQILRAQEKEDAVKKKLKDSNVPIIDISNA